LLKLDDEALAACGVASKLQRRAMLASLEAFRSHPEDGVEAVKALKHVESPRAPDTGAWERVGEATTDQQGYASFLVREEGTYVPCHVPPGALPRRASCSCHASARVEAVLLSRAPRRPPRYPSWARI